MTDNTLSGSDNDVTRKDPSTGVETHSIKGTQELDEILRDLARYAGIARDNLHTGRVEGQYERFMNEETQAVNEAKQAITAWHNKQMSELLDRLAIEVRASDYIGIAETIQSERNKLKESTDE